MLLLWLACVACSDPPPPPPPPLAPLVTWLEPRAVKPGPRPAPLPVGGREITLDSKNATPIREVTLDVPADAKEYTLRKAKGARVIFEGPHLVLVGEGPVAPGRFLVRVKASEDDDAETVAVHLVDIDRGSIAKFDDATGWQAPKFGLATVYRNTPIGRERLLLHASDGHTVPLDAPYIGTLTDVEINPVRGDAWVFTHDEATATTKVAHWTDLRKPPPMATQEFPICALDFGAAMASEPFTTLVSMPSAREGADTDPIAYPESYWKPDQECRRIALHRDGSFECANYDFELGEGWFAAQQGDDAVMFNKVTGDLQRLVLKDGCRRFDPRYASVSHTPPRMAMSCKGDEFVLWSPDRLERVKFGYRAEKSEWEWNDADNVIGRARWVGDPGDARRIYDRWLDLSGRVLVHTPDLDTDEGYIWNRSIPLEDRSPRARRQVVLRFDDLRIDVVHRNYPCTDAADEGTSSLAFLITCEGPSRRLKWAEKVDPTTETALRFPPNHGVWHRRIVLDPGNGRVVQVRRRASKDQLVVWSP